MNRNKFTATVLVVAFCVLTVWGLKALSRAPIGKMDLDKRALLRAKGSPGAPLWIVEYLDFQCAGCKMISQLVDEYLEKYPSAVYVQTRFYPLTSHTYGLRTALYAECAARQGKFWPLHDLLFEHQAEWSVLGDAEGAFRGYARQAGLNMAKLDTCLKDPGVEKAVLEEKEAAAALGVHVTPTFFMNGRIVVGPTEIKRALEVHFSKENVAGEKQ